MKRIETQSNPLPTLLPSSLTEWLVPHAQAIAHDCFSLFAFKGRNARRRKAIVLDVHSTPGALKEARKMCSFATTHTLFIHSKDLIPLHRSYTTTSLLSDTVTICLLQDVTRHLFTALSATKLSAARQIFLDTCARTMNTRRLLCTHVHFLTAITRPFRSPICRRT